MSWTLNPTPRGDLLLEQYTSLDGSGAYSGDWIETAGIAAIRVALAFNGGSPTVRVDESIYPAPSGGSGVPKVVRENAVPVSSLYGYAEIDLCARYYRVVIAGGLSSGTVSMSVRAA